jgi:hypothetical protein
VQLVHAVASRHSRLGRQVVHEAVQLKVMSGEDVAALCAVLASGDEGAQSAARARNEGRTLLLPYWGAMYDELTACSAQAIAGGSELAELYSKYLSASLLMVLPASGALKRGTGALFALYSPGFDELRDVVALEGQPSEALAAFLADPSRAASSCNATLRSEANPFASYFAASGPALRAALASVLLAVAVHGAQQLRWRLTTRVETHFAMKAILFLNVLHMAALAVLIAVDGWMTEPWSPISTLARIYYLPLFLAEGTAANMLLALLWSAVVKERRSRAMWLLPVLILLADYCMVVVLALGIMPIWRIVSIWVPVQLALEVVISLFLLFKGLALHTRLRWLAEAAVTDRRADALMRKMCRYAILTALTTLVSVVLLVSYQLGFARVSPPAHALFIAAHVLVRATVAFCQDCFCAPMPATERGSSRVLRGSSRSLRGSSRSLAGVVPIREGGATRKTPSSRDTSAVLSAQIRVLELSDNPSEPLSPDGDKAREPLSSGGSSSPLHDEARGEGAAEGGASYKMPNSD